MSNQPGLNQAISLILLAAGSSFRMGQSKQLLPLKNEPLLLRSTKAVLSSSVGNVIVVLGDNEKEHRSVIAHLPIQIVVNQTWSYGMGRSIKTGLHYVINSQPNVQAVMIAVCDQPLLTHLHLDKIIATYQQTQKSIVASYYSNSAGVPALFDKCMFSELLNIKDDQGAKMVFQKYPEMLALVDFHGGEIDLDTWQEYQDFKNQFI